jgi:hypothetical protein
MTSAGLRTAAADLYLQARIKDFEAALFQGSRDELERARLAALSGFEALLDAKHNVAWLLMKQMGINPEDRP